MATTIGGASSPTDVDPRSRPRTRSRGPAHRRRRRSLASIVEQLGSVADTRRHVVAGLGQAARPSVGAARSACTTSTRTGSVDELDERRRRARLRSAPPAPDRRVDRRVPPACRPSPCRPRRAGRSASGAPRRPPARRRPPTSRSASRSPRAARSASSSAAPPSSGSRTAISGACTDDGTACVEHRSQLAGALPRDEHAPAGERTRRRDHPSSAAADRAARDATSRSSEVPSSASRSPTARPRGRIGEERCAAFHRRTWAPTGNEQPEPSSARNARSTSTACRVAA